MRDVTYRVLALDPGGTTGWATYSANSKSESYNRGRFTCGQLGPGKHHQALEQLMGLQHVLDFTIVCERFQDRVGEHAVDLMAREYIGTVERFCQERSVPLVMQTPSYAKRFILNENIKNGGLWSVGAGSVNRHASDALRHLLSYMINGTPQRHDWLRKIGKGPK